MEHHFDTDIAKEYGVYEAILINNFMFWIAKNKANNKHFYENRYWTYNSVKALSELFPYFSEGQVRRVIDNLVTKEVLIKGNFNQNPYDKTLWYAIDETKISSLRINQHHLMKSTNGSDEIDNSFTDIKPTDNKPNQKPNYNPEIDIIYSKYPSECYVKSTSTGKTLKNKEKIRSIIKDKGFEWLFERVESYLVSCKQNKVYLKNFSTFLNNIPEPIEVKPQFKPYVPNFQSYEDLK